MSLIRNPQPTISGRGRSSLLRAAVAVLVGALAFAALPAPADAQEVGSPVTWGVRPADTEHGTDRPNYAYGVDPGGALSDAIIVSNYGDVPQTFRVYAADGFITEAGQLDLLPAAEPSTQLGSWVTFDAPEVTVPAKESVSVPFRIAVPADATPGDYAAGVVSSILVGADSGVAVDRRLGSRMYLRVGGELVPQLSIDGVDVSFSGGLNPFAPGSATVTYTVTNVGNTRLEAGQQVDVAGPFGWAGASASADAIDALPEMLPGTSTTRTVVVDGVWPLFVATASVQLRSAVVSAAFGPAAVDPASVPEVATVRADAAAPAVPWGALVILLLIVGLIVLLRVRTRRGKAREDARVAAAVAAALGTAEGTPVSEQPKEVLETSARS